MLFCESISLFQFRNYASQQFHFNEKVVGITGKNGTGKTNLLDAIYYLSFTKSAFAKPDAQSAADGCLGWRIEGVYQKQNQTYSLACVLRENNRKEFYEGNAAITKFSSHIGRYPAVCIAPDDISLINEGGTERRRFLDTLISQINQDYLQVLLRYQKLLDQRNRLLQEFITTNRLDSALLDVTDMQLAEAGEKIYEERTLFLQSFFPLVESVYHTIANEGEKIHFRYKSHQEEGPLATQLSQFRNRDLSAGRSTRGPHKDDLVAESGSYPFKNIASQGQRKSLLFAFKLAEVEILTKSKGFAPILLLDDVFEKLDAGRVENLLATLCNQAMQVFITDTEKERLQKALKPLKINLQIISL